MSGCNSKPDLDNSGSVEISNNMLDTIPENRSDNYKETIEKELIYLKFVWYWVQPVVRRKVVSSTEGMEKSLLNMPDTVNPIYRRAVGLFVFIHKLRMKLNQISGDLSAEKNCN